MGITKVYDLTINYLKNPLGLDETPRFSYKLAADCRGAVQKSCRIRVASEAALLQKGIGNLWDSGEIVTDDTLHIEYQGKKLPPVHRCFWNVTVTKENSETVTSESTFFVTGKLGTAWDANWITADFMGKGEKAADRENSALKAAYLRHEFKLAKPVKEAFLLICGLGYFEAHLNGKKVGDDVLSTPFTRFDETVMYNTYDVKDMLSKENAIGVILGNGWYNCFADDPWNTKQATWRHFPKMIAELHVTYEDGTAETICSRTDWKSSDGPIYFNGIRNGEHYDARKELGNWTEIGYDDGAWQNSKIIRGPGGQLIGMNLQPIKIHHEFPAVKLWKTETGWVFDIGQNQAGVARFKLRGPAGTEITMKYTDILNPDRTINLAAIGGFIRSHGFQTDKYIKKSDNEEVWQAIFVYHGFQYVEISGIDYEPKLDDVVGLTMYTSFNETGHFDCSDELLNRVQHLCRWSTLSNCESIPTDCPHREKNGWTGDGAASSEQILINFGAQAFYSKWLDDMRTSQRPAGQIPCVVPSTGWGYNSMNGPDWSMGLTDIPWTIYTYNNDRHILEKNYEAIKRHCSYMESMSDDYTVHYGLGDWCAPFEGPAISINMSSFKCPTAVSDTGCFYDAALKLSKMAKLLGKPEDEKYYTELAGKIKAAFRKKFYDEATHTVAGDCQTSTAAMLFQEIAEPEDRPVLLAKLVEQIHRDDDHVDFGLLGCKYVMHTLGAMGEGNLGFKMLAQRTFPGCQQWIDLGATTLWECWNGGGSHNHHMFSDLSAFMYKYVGGISPDETRPGFSHTILRPAIDCGLEFANAEYESMYGKVTCRWTNKDGKQTLDINVPVCCEATLYLPASYIGKLSENGKLINFTTKTADSEYAVTLPSGEYHLTAEK
ncbi:MAG TPA: family 78 glycoside hydrolase catalytic domain [Oscillospiraceae bacterium]|nr:family 78 glycoside hydrolase catalytic domain [Oscillospiraceae bacterium]HPF55470.1 family 78 glycoside hydrolase catalytic domain [Clostridiales bacterium]HPK34304.1 family 78 glycoside hydrolase catalytic domain [Oscillospiraceae bacterium]